ncbi:tRNA (adenine(22)-N(1))-methyltransferase [Defluviitalea phaphyphila]|uniref:tRNA (adenine(22)-N(1))-methyltransferase n=1 Tax=Defluviitalea phaphyphila TaxID=1473580 RepID=UPI000730B5D9|nr:class I SAM-dependent methyltransferase [Defluviitalea phaphyphila]
MELSSRLLSIAKQVPKEAIIADIGTDHAYIPIYLCKRKIIKKAIATDINKGPLIRAKQNIKQNKLEQIIETRLGNGLEPIKINEVNTIIIAGMGGKLIIDILDKKPEIVKGAKRIILQPQIDQKEVRKYLHKINFKIINEEIIYEDNKYYFVITAEPGIEKYNNEKEYLFGVILVLNKNPILKQYIQQRIITLHNILNKLQKINTENTLKRLFEIKEEIKYCEEVLKCL